MFLLDWINYILQALGLSNKQARIVVLGESLFTRMMRKTRTFVHTHSTVSRTGLYAQFLDTHMLSFLTWKMAGSFFTGLDNAGKSTLVHKLCKNEVRAFVPTTKAQAQTFTLGKVQFTAWDLGGHEQVKHNESKEQFCNP